MPKQGYFEFSPKNNDCSLEAKSGESGVTIAVTEEDGFDGTEFTSTATLPPEHAIRLRDWLIEVLSD